ncbi:unnamed protein product [Protopolystoma xenopodis]|uniref:Uncharacterized protein n=1 Tax=Protopolystoma xenopodis TaxID=117903 RepID=A0A448WTF5_9PLAT|nr:unnamed protein product [Protopolystoma xenopodis]
MTFWSPAHFGSCDRRRVGKSAWPNKHRLLKRGWHDFHWPVPLQHPRSAADLQLSLDVRWIVWILCRSRPANLRFSAHIRQGEATGCLFCGIVLQKWTPLLPQKWRNSSNFCFLASLEAECLASAGEPVVGRALFPLQVYSSGILDRKRGTPRRARLLGRQQIPFTICLTITIISCSIDNTAE